jgi:hypothetical protein
VVIDVGPVDEENGNGANGNGNGNGVTAGARGWARRQKMVVTGNPDGSVLLTPDSADHLLVVSGDPAQGEVTITEVLPAGPVE